MVANKEVDIQTERQNGVIWKSIGFFLLLWSIMVLNLKADDKKHLIELSCHNESVSRQILKDWLNDSGDLKMLKLYNNNNDACDRKKFDQKANRCANK